MAAKDTSSFSPDGASQADSPTDSHLGAIARALLDWYDGHARDLPWRVGPAARARGMRPDPYRVWLSEIMLQQTTVATVAPRYQRFLDRWPCVAALAAAPLDDILGEWAGLGYYARARNLHACAQAVVDRHNGEFPCTEEELRTLPGVGAYTAAAIATIAFDRKAVPVDGNIERVAARLFAISTPPPRLKDKARTAIGTVWPDARHGDFTQSLMDLGSGICRPRKPACLICPLNRWCAGAASGAPTAYPARAPKAAKPQRVGKAFAIFRDDGALLLERRPEQGLLGGMLGLPGTDWREVGAGDETDAAIVQRATIDWREAGVVDHVFTHFRLSLTVYAGAAPKGFRKRRDEQWVDPDEARAPTVMKKAIAAARACREKDRNP